MPSSHSRLRVCRPEQTTLLSPTKKLTPPLAIPSRRLLATQQARLLRHLAQMLSHLCQRLLWRDMPAAEEKRLRPVLARLEHNVRLAHLLVSPPSVPCSEEDAFLKTVEDNDE